MKLSDLKIGDILRHIDGDYHVYVPFINEDGELYNGYYINKDYIAGYNLDDFALHGRVNIFISHNRLLEILYT